jgi:hypothetical protein
VVFNTDTQQVCILETLKDQLDQAPSFSFNEITEVSCSRHVKVRQSDHHDGSRITWILSVHKRDGSEWILSSFHQEETCLDQVERLKQIIKYSDSELNSEIDLELDLELDLEPSQPLHSKTQWTLEPKHDTLYKLPFDLTKKEETIGPFVIKKQADLIEILWKRHRSKSRTIGSYLFAVGCGSIGFGFGQKESVFAWLGSLVFVILMITIFRGISKAKLPRWIRITSTQLSTPSVITPFSNKEPLSIPTSEIYSAFFNLSEFSHLQVMTVDQYEEMQMYKKEAKIQNLNLKRSFKAAFFQHSILSIDITTLSIAEILILENLIENSVYEMSGQAVL